MCLFAAATFWFLNAMNKSYTTALDYPVELAYDTTEFVKVAEPTKTFRVNVSGSGWELAMANFGYEITPMRYEVKRLPETGHVLASTFLPEMSESINQFEVNYVYKDKVKLGLSERIQKQIPLKTAENPFPEKSSITYVGEMLIEPAVCLVEGASTLVSKLDTMVIPAGQEFFLGEGAYYYYFDPQTKLPTGVLSLVDSVKVSVPAKEVVRVTRIAEVQVLNANRSTMEPVDLKVGMTYGYLKEASDPLEEDIQYLYVDMRGITEKDTSVVIKTIGSLPSVRDLKITPETLKIAPREN